MAACGSHRDQAKIRAYADDSVAQYHWLVGHGVPFKAVFYPDYSGEPPTDDGLVFGLERIRSRTSRSRRRAATCRRFRESRRLPME
jgi:hypothetical protein